jgi:hypothetical protein
MAGEKLLFCEWRIIARQDGRSKTKPIYTEPYALYLINLNIMEPCCSVQKKGARKMDFKLELQHEVATCVALAFAVESILNEVVDNGGAAGEPVEHACRVQGLLQDRLDQATPVVAAPLIPDSLPLSLGSAHAFIPCFCTRRTFLP